MKLGKFEMQETGSLHLRDAGGELMYADGADGKPDTSKPITWHGFGPGSKEYERALTTRNARALERLRKKGKTEGTATEIKQDSINFLVACTDRIDNVDDEVKDVFSNQKLSFIRDQVNEYLNETENFKPASSTN